MRHLRPFSRFFIAASLLAVAGPALIVPAQAEAWREGAPMSTARANAGGVLVGDDLYVIGGSSTSGPRSLTEIYDTVGNIWRAAAAMPVGLEQFGTATDGSKIYVSGGFENSGVPGEPIVESNELRIFDIRNGAWSNGPKMPDVRVGHSLVCVDGKVYVIGGRGPSASRMFVFDIGANEWSISKTAVPFARSDSAAVAVGKDIYVIGGKDGSGASSRVDIYDTSRGVWRSGPALPAPRDGHVAALNADEIHVSGGQTISPPKTYADHFVLDLKTNSWRREAALPTPRHGSIAAASHGKFIVVGGAPGAGVYTVFTSSDVVDIYTGK
tara:strand:- start:14432 stop:15409 length:978 start_codon:yes stop_codon:yes gene_type:complete